MTDLSFDKDEWVEPISKLKVGSRFTYPRPSDVQVYKLLDKNETRAKIILISDNLNIEIEVPLTTPVRVGHIWEHLDNRKVKNNILELE